MTTCGDYSSLGPKLDMLESEFTASLISNRGLDAVEAHRIATGLMRDVRELARTEGRNLPRDLEVSVYYSALGDDAIVVQIDTGSETKRLRVNVNDGAVWDGDPETHPGVSVGFMPFDTRRALELLVDIGEDVANHVLEFFGHSGYAPGSNRTHVLNAIVTADTSTFVRLSAAFPDYAAAVVLARQVDDGVAMLRQRAGR